MEGQHCVSFLRYGWLFAYRKSELENPSSRSWVRSKVKGQGHIVDPTTYRLTSLRFHVNRPFHSWGMAISIFDLESPSSRSELKITQWAQHPIDSHSFPSMSIDPPIPDIHSSFKIWPWIFKVIGEVKVQSHKVGLIPFSNFDLENPRSTSLGEVKGWGHTISPASIWSISFLFHFNRPNHSHDINNSMFYWQNWLGKHLSNRIPPKLLLVRSMTRGKWLPNFVVIG